MLHWLTLHIGLPPIDRGRLAPQLTAWDNVRAEHSGLLLSPVTLGAVQELVQCMHKDELALSAPSSYRFFIHPPNIGAVELALQSGDDIQACVLTADGFKHEFAPLNDKCDFITWHGLPCKGQLRKDVPLETAEKPSGLVYRVGDELLFSSSAADFLVDTDPSLGWSYGDVNWRGRMIPKWHRFHVKVECDVIDNVCLKREMLCGACSAETRPAVGVWVAQPDALLPDSAALDRFQYNHAGEARPLVVRNELALALTARFSSRKFKLEPVWRADSYLGELIRSCAELLRTLAYHR